MSSIDGTVSRLLLSARSAETSFDALVVAADVVLVFAVLAVIYVIVRRSPVQASGAPLTCSTDTPSFPRRRHYLLLALFLTAVGIYGSLVPLSYRPLEISEAIERFKEIPYLSLGIDSRADFVENIFLFIPISYCWLAVLAVDRRPFWLTMLAALLVVLLCNALSIALEFTQLWFPPRTVSQNDVIAETIGALIGAGLWLTMGQAITDWVRSYTSSVRLKSQIDWLLQAYFVGLLIYSVLPLDLTISLTELVHKYRAGRISLVPFSEMEMSFAFFFRLFRDVVIFIPVGMLAATWLTSAQQPVRRISTSVLFGGLAVLTIELAQLIVYTRPTATGDVITGTLGVLLGAWVMRRWRGRGRDARRLPVSHGKTQRVWLWLGLAGVYSLLLMVVFCTPFELIDDPEQIKARYHGFFSVPFAGLYRTIDLDALSDVVKKLLFCAPLGALFGLAVMPLSVPLPIRRILLALLLMVAAGVGASIEMMQVFLPPHVPEITDVILYTVGAAIGMLVTVQMAGRQAKDSFTRR
ncbi:MAG: VanZ family protein [Planctomycetota bacterium]